MPKTYVERSIEINANIKKVKNIISDFNHWRTWSPWLILEPEAKVTVSEDSKTQEWEGKRIGSGKMTYTGEKDGVLYYDLMFLKPWKSKATADFIVEALGDNKTKLTWTMKGSLPFFMFWMKTIMQRMIGMDYDRGLLMLKDYIENGNVGVKLEFLGESNYAGCNYVGVKTICTVDGIGEAMECDFGKLMPYAKGDDENLKDEIFSIYHKFDFNRNKVIYTSGVAVHSIPENLPEGFISGQIPATKIQTVRHIGPYELSGNAWSAIMAMERAKEFKQNKKIPPMEFYRNSPKETDPKDLISDVYMAIL